MKINNLFLLLLLTFSFSSYSALDTNAKNSHLVYYANNIISVGYKDLVTFDFSGQIFESETEIENYASNQMLASTCIQWTSSRSIGITSIDFDTSSRYLKILGSYYDNLTCSSSDDGLLSESNTVLSLYFSVKAVCDDGYTEESTSCIAYCDTDVVAQLIESDKNSCDLLEGTFTYTCSDTTYTPDCQVPDDATGDDTSSDTTGDDTAPDTTEGDTSSDTNGDDTVPDTSSGDVVSAINALDSNISDSMDLVNSGIEGLQTSFDSVNESLDTISKNNDSNTESIVSEVSGVTDAIKSLENSLTVTDKHTTEGLINFETNDSTYGTGYFVNASDISDFETDIEDLETQYTDILSDFKSLFDFSGDLSSGEYVKHTIVMTVAGWEINQSSVALDSLVENSDLIRTVLMFCCAVIGLFIIIRAY